MTNDAEPTEPDSPPATPGDGPAAAPADSRTSTEAEPEVEADGPRRRWPLKRHRGEDDESFAHRLAHQWATMRDERRNEPEPVAAGTSNFNRAQVPWGLDLAAAWAWRALVIGAAGYAIFWVLAYFSVIALPLVVALLITALVSPLVNAMQRVGIPRGLASITVVLGGLAAVAVLLTFVGQQVAGGASDLADSTVQGLGEIKDWLKDGPLNASDSQIDGYIEKIQDAITEQSQDGDVLGQVTELGATLGHVLAGFFIVLFSTFFFLSEGSRIWAWAVRLAPRAARERVDSSGRVAWISLTQFVRATVIVALVDAVGIMIGAAIIGVPFVLAIGVLVFLGAFVPLIGATVAGSVAVLVALVDQGPIAALAMLAVVIGVQQLEGHVLQPFLMGRWVAVHPLGVIIAIAAGVIVGGVAGALVAVPLAAALNAVVQHLASYTAPGDDPEEALAEDYAQGSATDSLEDQDDVVD